MRASTRFSDAIHILCFLKVYEEARITSDLLSSSIGISPVMVRRLMGNLRQAGLVQTTQGTAQPRLARDLQKITLYDVYYTMFIWPSKRAMVPTPSSTLTPILTPSVRSVVTFNQS